MVGGGENAASIPFSEQTRIKSHEVRAGDVKQQRGLKEKRSGGGGDGGDGGTRGGTKSSASDMRPSSCYALPVALPITAVQ